MSSANMGDVQDDEIDDEERIQQSYGGSAVAIIHDVADRDDNRASCNDGMDPVNTSNGIRRNQGEAQHIQPSFFHASARPPVHPLFSPLFVEPTNNQNVTDLAAANLSKGASPSFSFLPSPALPPSSSSRADSEGLEFLHALPRSMRSPSIVERHASGSDAGVANSYAEYSSSYPPQQKQKLQNPTVIIAPSSQPPRHIHRQPNTSAPIRLLNFWLSAPGTATNGTRPATYPCSSFPEQDDLTARLLAPSMNGSETLRSNHLINPTEDGEHGVVAAAAPAESSLHQIRIGSTVLWTMDTPTWLMVRQMIRKFGNYLAYCTLLTMLIVVPSVTYHALNDRSVDKAAFNSAWVMVCGTIIMSCRLVYLHLTHWYMPEVQTYVVRILWMVPLYAMQSYLSLRFHEARIYIDTVRDLYEAYVIASFVYYLIALLGGEDELVALLRQKSDQPELGQHAFPFRLVLQPWELGTDFMLQCKHGVLQYVLFKAIATILTFLFESAGIYGEGKFEWFSAYPYMCFFQNVSVMYALYCLVMLYSAVNEELRSPINWRPLGKFLCVKGVIFFTWWQGVVIFYLRAHGIIQKLGSWSSEDVANGLIDYCIVIEMVGFAIAHSYTFTYLEYLPSNLPPDSGRWALYTSTPSRDIDTQLNSVGTHQTRGSGIPIDDCSDLYLHSTSHRQQLHQQQQQRDPPIRPDLFRGHHHLPAGNDLLRRHSRNTEDDGDETNDNENGDSLLDSHEGRQKPSSHEQQSQQPPRRYRPPATLDQPMRFKDAFWKSAVPKETIQDLQRIGFDWTALQHFLAARQRERDTSNSNEATIDNQGDGDVESGEIGSAAAAASLLTDDEFQTTVDRVPITGSAALSESAAVVNDDEDERTTSSVVISSSIPLASSSPSLASPSDAPPHQDHQHSSS